MAPAAFNVNTVADTVEAVRDGSGLDANGNISLRSALMATNDTGGTNTINLPAGTYLLTIPPAGSNDDESGDLTIGRGLVHNNLTIAGDSSTTTIIDGNALDRIFDVGFFCTATLTNLTVQNGKGALGGGLSNSGQVTLTNDIFTKNAAGQGAGIINSGTGTVNISDCIIENNTASQAGGILNGGTMTIADSIITANMAAQGGGILNSGQLTMTGTTLSSNMTTAVVGEGGGLFNQNTVMLTNDTLANNTASQGGALYTFGQDTATLVNCTIAGNTASSAFFSAGGGIYGGIGNPVVALKNTLVALNQSDSGPDIQATVSSLGHNLIGVATGATGLSNSDLAGTSDNPLNPLLGPLQANGGSTPTMALLPGSPAIDTGDNTDAPDFDQRGSGFPRIVGGTIDIGAFEVQPGLASHFQISAPAMVASNTPFDLTVIALDAYGHIAVGYLGTVVFSTSDADPAVALPGSYTFTADDQGIHTFAGLTTLITVGNQSLVVTDQSDNSITGTAVIIVNPSPAAPPGGDATAPWSPPVRTVLITSAPTPSATSEPDAGTMYSIPNR
jgi:hypothetical protein